MCLCSKDADLRRKSDGSHSRAHVCASGIISTGKVRVVRLSAVKVLCKYLHFPA